MQIKTFCGESLGEALGQVKAEFGEEAIILSSRAAEDSLLPLAGGSRFEVTAARPAAMRSRSPAPQQDPRLTERERRVEGRGAAEQPGSTTRPREGSAAGSLRPRAMNRGDKPQESETELRRLRDEVREMRATLRDVSRVIHFGDPVAAPPGGEAQVKALLEAGVSRVTARSLLEELSEPKPGGGDAAPDPRPLLARRLVCAGRSEPAPERPLLSVFAGPSGAGKTSSIAKLLLNQEGYAGRRTGILSLDTRRIAAVEQIRKLAGLARANLQLVYRPAELSRALDGLSQCEVILVDTPGAGPGDRIALERLKRFMELLQPAEIHLVLAASMNSEDQLAMVAAFRRLGANRLLLTKLDETRRLGAVLDLVRRSRLPLSYLGFGQEIPAGLGLARPAELASWILDPALLEQRREAALLRTEG